MALNITGTNATTDTVIIAYAANTAIPITSNVNPLADTNKANLAIIPVATTKSVTLHNYGGIVDLIADLAGYFLPASGQGFTPTALTRALDTRSGIGAAAGAGPAPEASTALAEIPYAVRWLVPRGERFANFDILNDNDTQLDYYRRFGHIYAVGVPARKWRLVVVSDPELLDEVAADEEQFGKRVEEINFFAQLANSRGGGLSVIGDGPHYERIRRVMLPWYSPAHQRTQLDRMKDQAGRLPPVARPSTSRTSRSTR